MAATTERMKFLDGPLKLADGNRFHLQNPRPGKVFEVIGAGNRHRYRLTENIEEAEYVESLMRP